MPDFTGLGSKEISSAIREHVFPPLNRAGFEDRRGWKGRY